MNSSALFSLCALSLFVVSSSPMIAEESELPLVYETGFESGADDWKPTEAETWKLKETDQGNVYSLFKKQSTYQPKFRSPSHISLLKDVKVESFQFDVDILSTHEDYNHRDVCLFFGYQNPDEFYYLHLGKKTDDHANQIFIVNQAARTKISTKTTDGTNWDDKWHHVRIKRNAETGSIAVFFDDMDEPVMTAIDKSFAWGQIGVGSFDDIADFDNIKLRGKKHDVK